MGGHADHPLRNAAAKVAYATVLACLLLLKLAATAAASPQPTMKLVDASGLAPSAASIVDTTLAPRFERATAGPSASSLYTAPDGARVSVDVSSGYRREPARVQHLVDFVASLVHGPELGRLSISIRTPAELQGICGVGADACYAPALMRMIVPGEDLRDVTLEHLIAHEYGHHVLASQRNAPWNANAWGAKRWATYEGVCAREARGEVFPGDEAEHYRLNPAEGFAEAYRVVNAERAGSWGASAWITDPLFFYPDAEAARLLEQDVLHPLDRPATVKRSIALRSGQTRLLRVATPWDGILRASARDAQVSVLDTSGRPPSAWRRNASATVCGQRSIVVAVRGSAPGRYTLTLRRP